MRLDNILFGLKGCMGYSSSSVADYCKKNNVDNVIVSLVPNNQTFTRWFVPCFSFVCPDGSKKTCYVKDPVESIDCRITSQEAWESYISSIKSKFDGINLSPEFSFDDLFLEHKIY